MTDNLWTKGPWACQPVDKDGPDYGVTIIGLRLNDDGSPMETPTNGIVGAALPYPTEIDSGDYSRVEANAHLIASAPSLYDALAACRLELDYCQQQLAAHGQTGRPNDSVSRALDSAKSAMELARGEPA